MWSMLLKLRKNYAHYLIQIINVDVTAKWGKYNLRLIKIHHKVSLKKNLGSTISEQFGVHHCALSKIILHWKLFQDS